MYVIVGIKGFTLDEAQEVRQFVGERKLKGIATWNNKADFRSCRTNGNEIQYKVVQCLALGDRKDESPGSGDTTDYCKASNQN